MGEAEGGVGFGDITIFKTRLSFYPFPQINIISLASAYEITAILPVVSLKNTFKGPHQS